MTEARDIELAPVAARVGGLDLVARRRQRPRGDAAPHAGVPQRGFPFIADPSQQLACSDGAGIRRLVDGAAFLFTNEYEADLTEQKTGWTHDEILDRVDIRVTTLGSDGVTIHRKGEETVASRVAREVRRADPTGVGDAFRAGFLAGLALGPAASSGAPRSAPCSRPTSSRRSARRSTS